MLRPPTTYTLFPYTTLFRSRTMKPTSVLFRLRAAREAATTVTGGVYDHLRPLRRSQGLPAKGNCGQGVRHLQRDRKSKRLNSSHTVISYAVVCLKKKTKKRT